MIRGNVPSLFQLRETCNFTDNGRGYMATKGITSWRKKNARCWRDVTCLWWTRLFRANASRVPRTVAIGLRIGVFLMRGFRRSADGRHAVTLIHPHTRLLDEISRDTLTSALRDTLDSVKNLESQLALADWSWRHRGGRAHQRDWPWGSVRIAPHSN